jgi:Ca-activated chloride channel family protein
MSIQAWFRLPRVRRGLAVSLVVLSTGGLVLARTPASGMAFATPESHVVVAGGSNAATFQGPGITGRVALSHTRVLSGGEQRIFAEVDVKADAAARRAERAPLSMVVVLDTSGSMGGEKIEEARRSAARLVREMRDDDEIAFVRYASDAQVVQPLARVGQVREQLISAINMLNAGGGTDIPRGLRLGLGELDRASAGRVRRVVLASDGLDASRVMAEQLARDASARGVTVSSMGIGLDFDESYMGGLAVAGHGNFAFVKDGAALATFLQRELTETATTVAQNVTARLQLPAGVRFVQAIGAEGRQGYGGDLALSVGSLFAGDERRVLVELAATVPLGMQRNLEGTVSWSGGGGDTATARFSGLGVSGSDDPLAVQEGRDGAVIANATSVLASTRQLAAAEAYERGDVARAQAIVDQNMRDLQAAAAAAPPAARPQLAEQAKAYDGARTTFAAPRSAAAAAKTKAAAAQDFNNLGRQGY